MVGEEERDGVRLTSLDQPLGDDLDVTKGDLVDYLDAVADRHRPAARGPAAVGQAGAARAGAVHAAQRVQGRAGLGADRSRVVGGVAPRDRPGALRRPAHPAVAGQPARRRVPRPLLPRRGRTSRPGLVLDLDPPEGADFAIVVRAARLVRQALDGLRAAAGAVKTSGSKGVHVVVPVRGAPFEDVAAATRALAARTERLDPSSRPPPTSRSRPRAAASSSTPRARARRTIVAAYSPRIRPGLPGVRPGRLGRAGRRAAGRTSP